MGEDLARPDDFQREEGRGGQGRGRHGGIGMPRWWWGALWAEGGGCKPGLGSLLSPEPAQSWGPQKVGRRWWATRLDVPTHVPSDLGMASGLEVAP